MRALAELRADIRRLPRRHRVVAGLALAYLASPIDLIPDFVPVVGQLDDIALIVWLRRYIRRHARDEG